MGAVNNITYNHIVFTRFTGKNYAVFASLGKIVKIGHVNEDTADKAIQKSSLCNTATDVCNSEEKSDSPLEKLTLLLSSSFIIANILIKEILEQFSLNDMISETSSLHYSIINKLKYLSLPLIILSMADFFV